MSVCILWSQVISYRRWRAALRIKRSCAHKRPEPILQRLLRLGRGSEVEFRLIYRAILKHVRLHFVVPEYFAWI